MEPTNEVSARLRPGDLKDCSKLPVFGRTLDVGEFLLDAIAQNERESLTKFSKYEHQSHEVFVEEHIFSAVGEKFWRQVGRWVKYEEMLEESGSRWGKPHIPALNFHSLINLRRILEAGLISLDLDAFDLDDVSRQIVDSMEQKQLMESGDLTILKQQLLLKHKHVTDSEAVWSYLNKKLKGGGGGLSNLEMGDIGLSLEELKELKKLSDLMRKIPRNSEGGLLLVGKDESMKGLAVAFIRLADGICMPNVTEIPIPVRFIFVLLGPSSCELNYREVGRCMAILLTNSIFRHIAYEARERRDLLVALNEFLDASIVLPHGDWDFDLFHLHELRQRADSIYERKVRLSLSLPTDEVIPSPDDEERSPFKRTKLLFGGVINDVVRRYPLYWTDIRDAFNIQCFATIIFLYFANVAGGIALGEVLRAKTSDFIGISETLFGNAVAGVIFALLSAQPLLIVATTGPTLVFDESLFNFCSGRGMQDEFLAMRFWIGIWIVLIGLCVVGAEGSVIARYVTRFTQEIFAVFISIVFIWESLKDVLTSTKESSFVKLVVNENKSLVDSGEFFIDFGLTIATFGIALTLRAFKDSSYGTILIRKLLGNFGVLMSILTMAVIAYVLMPFDPSKNLIIPDAIHGLKTTREEPRLRMAGWFVKPMVLPVPWIFGSFLPALLLFVLIFLEVSIGQLIMSRREALMKKGSGFHLDILLICFINSLMGFLGTTWISSATVRGVTHLVALTVYSTDNAPGEKPRVIGTKEQRVTAFMTSILVGCSVVMGMILKYVPMSVLLGVFLYMGVSALRGIQFTDRILLFFKQVVQHPEVSYVKRVRTWKMHVFTLIQIISLSVIWAIKISPAALILPLIFTLLIPFRKFVLVRFYSEVELEAMDGKGTQPIGKKEPLHVDVTPFSEPLALLETKSSRSFSSSAQLSEMIPISNKNVNS